MKECTIIVKKVYENKKTRTVTEKTIILSEEALNRLCVYVSCYMNNTSEPSLRQLLNAIKEV